MLNALKTQYLEHMRLRNLSALTIRQMEQNLRFFLNYAQAKGIRQPDDLDRAAFEDYKNYLAQEYKTKKGVPLATNTLRPRLFTVQAWFAFMKKRGVLAFNPIADVQIPKRAKILPKGIMKLEEIRRVMEQADLKTPLGYRDRTMMELLYAAGLRCAELLNLKISDVDLDKKIVRVRHGKGGRDRFVPISTPCVRFLQRYMAATRPCLAQNIRPSGNNWKERSKTGGDLLFISIYGGSLRKNWLGAMMKQYIQKAGIKKPVSPVHSFRHSVATHLLESGMDIRYVQVFLGHESINSTQIYTHVERRSLQRLFKAHHPREIALSQGKEIYAGVA